MLTRRTLLAAALAPGAPRAAGFQRGVNFTAEQPDKYDSPKAVALLESLPQWGVNAVALVPYHVEALVLLADAEVRLGPAGGVPPEKAREHLYEALRFSPRHRGACDRLRLAGITGPTCPPR